MSDVKQYPAARAAVACCVPWSLVDSSESTILNSTPYVCDWECLTTKFDDEVRRGLIGALQGILDEARTAGIRARFLMVGGSFLQPHQTPKDIDCVVFYEVADCPSVAATIKCLNDKSKERGIDARWIPVDADPFVAIRSAIFFATLYSRGRQQSMADLRGVLMVLV